MRAVNAGMVQTASRPHPKNDVCNDVTVSDIGTLLRRLASAADEVSADASTE